MKAKILAILVVLAVMASSITGCGPKKGGYLIEIMKILPHDTPTVLYTDVELITEDPDLEGMYNDVLESWDDILACEANIATAIDSSHVRAFTKTDSRKVYLIAIKGEFDLQNIRDALLEQDFMQGEYEGVEVWTDDSHAFAFLKRMIVSGDASSVETSIRVSQNDEPSMYGNEDVKSIMDKLPAGFCSLILIGDTWGKSNSLLLAGGISMRKGEGVIEIKGWFKFESETDAEAVLPDLEDAMKEFLGATFIEGQLRDEFIELTGEIEIPED
jgi:hypothetical protein